jgi:hypothetical protein
VHFISTALEEKRECLLATNMVLQDHRAYGAIQY